MNSFITTVLILLLSITIQNNSKCQSNQLKVGDAAPSLSALKWVKGGPVRELKKGRAYVVEFGATWCKPCIEAMPHLSELDKKYRQDLDVVSFFIMESRRKDDNPESPTYVKQVENLIKKRGDLINYDVAVDYFNRKMELTWHRAAGLSGIPKSFIIDKNGFIAWIGTSTRYNEIVNAIEYVIGSDYKLSSMIDYANQLEASKPKFDTKKLLLVDGNGGEDESFEFRSLLRKSDQKFEVFQSQIITSEGWMDTLPRVNPTKGMIQFVNFQLVDLYFAAFGDTLRNMPRTRYPHDRQVWWEDVNPYHKESYGEYWHYPILEVNDPSDLGSTNWRIKHDIPLDLRYDYSLKVPEERATAKFMQEVMQRDLKNYFNYEVSVEVREMTCWKLTATPEAGTLLATKTPGEKYRSSFPEDGSFVFKNAIIKDILWSLGSHFGFQGFDYRRLPLEDQGPFVDETGLSMEIDYIFSKAHQESFEGFRDYLKSKGLILTKSTKPMKVVVIRDPVAPQDKRVN